MGPTLVDKIQCISLIWGVFSLFMTLALSGLNFGDNHKKMLCSIISFFALSIPASVVAFCYAIAIA